MIKFLSIIIFLINLSFSVSLFQIQGRDGAPNSWRKVARTDQDQKITFTLNLRQCNMDRLEAFFWDVSNPKSDNYGNYMSFDEINSLTSCDGDVESVLSVLSQHSIDSTKLFGNAIRVTASIKSAERLLNTNFFDFEHTDTKKIFSRQLGGVHLDDSLSGIVLFITGISDFFHDTKYSPIGFKKPSISPLMQDYNPNVFNITDPYVTPSLFPMLYGIPPTNEHVDAKNSFGIAAFDNDYDIEALCRFQDLFGSYGPAPQFSYSGPEEGSDQIESDLDVQYSSVIAKQIQPYFANHAPGQWILDWAQETSANENRALVYSLSYGWPEVWECNGMITQCPVGYDYQMYINACNQEFIKLGSMGVSIMVSSGDDGTPGFASNCPANPYATGISGMSCTRAMADNDCQCGNLLLVYSSPTGNITSCQFPNGLSYGSCNTQDQEIITLCTEAFDQLIGAHNINEQGQFCNISANFNEGYFFSNCTCPDIPTYIQMNNTDGSSCTVTGYYFDPSFGPAFFPDFPTSSPYVTSVGATALQFSSECQASIGPEIYCQASNAAGFSGGGGFSSFQPAPTFQRKFIDNYLSQAGSSLPPAATFNASFRGYPDVAFNGHNFVTSLGYTIIEENQQPTNLNGMIAPISGTSASSPAFSGMIALLNGYRLANGQSSLGYLNQLLYTMADEQQGSFNDIVPQEIDIMGITIEGGAFTGCTQHYCCEYGFPVTAGWDPATGLGTPVYPMFLKYLTAMMKK